MYSTASVVEPKPECGQTTYHTWLEIQMVQMVELYLAIGRCCCQIGPQTFLCQENIVFVEMDTSHLRKNRDGEIFESKIQMILVFLWKKFFETNVFGIF